MRTYSANAIVLRRIDLGEKDRILTLYTRELGKLSAVAKGSRRPGSKLGGASEPFTYSKMLLATGRDLDIVSQADIKESFPTSRTEPCAAWPTRSICWSLPAILLMSASRTPTFLTPLLSSMYVLESGTDPEITTRYFELNLLCILGYEPQVDACVRCSRKVGRERLAFSPSRGGIVCTNCGEPPTDAMWVPGRGDSSYVRALRLRRAAQAQGYENPQGRAPRPRADAQVAHPISAGARAKERGVY